MTTRTRRRKTWTREEVSAIRAAVAQGERQGLIATRHQTNASTVSLIANGLHGPASRLDSAFAQPVAVDRVPRASKLSRQDVADIRRAYAGDDAMTLQALANAYRVSLSAIHKVVDGRSYPYLPGPFTVRGQVFQTLADARAAMQA